MHHSTWNSPHKNRLSYILIFNRSNISRLPLCSFTLYVCEFVRQKIVSIFKSIIHYLFWPFNLAFSSDSIRNRNLWITNKRTNEQSSKQIQIHRRKMCARMCAFQKRRLIACMHACGDKIRDVFIFSFNEINQTKKNKK